MLQKVTREEETISVTIPASCVVLNPEHFEPFKELLGKVRIDTDFTRRPVFQTEFLLAFDEDDVGGPRFAECEDESTEKFSKFLVERVSLFAGDARSRFPLDLSSIILTADDDSRDEEIAYHVSEWFAEYVHANFHLTVGVSRNKNNLLAALLATFQPTSEQRTFYFNLPVTILKTDPMPLSRCYKYFGVEIG